jgi:transcriptional regulator with XRE-family HTH domain
MEVSFYTEVKQSYSKELGKHKYINFDKKELEDRVKTISEILSYLRKRAGFTQKDVADKIGMARQTYAGYESGRHEPNIEIMIRLAEIYQISMDYITGRYLGIDNQKYMENLIDDHEILEDVILHYQLQQMENERFMKQNQKYADKNKS